MRARTLEERARIRARHRQTIGHRARDGYRCAAWRRRWRWDRRWKPLGLHEAFAASLSAGLPLKFTICDRRLSFSIARIGGARAHFVELAASEGALQRRRNAAAEAKDAAARIAPESFRIRDCSSFVYASGVSTEPLTNIKPRLRRPSGDLVTPTGGVGWATSPRFSVIFCDVRRRMCTQWVYSRS